MDAALQVEVPLQVEVFPRQGGHDDHPGWEWMDFTMLVGRLKFQ
jgi:hypothetical protein